jgi:hypothetical protein
MIDINTTINLPLGQTVITRGALATLDPAAIPLALGRHIRGDWGDVPPEDWNENNLSVREGFRVLSSYTDKNGTRFWIITEADRSSTTVLLPEEY